MKREGGMKIEGSMRIEGGIKREGGINREREERAGHHRGKKAMNC